MWYTCQNEIILEMVENVVKLKKYKIYSTVGCDTHVELYVLNTSHTLYVRNTDISLFCFSESCQYTVFLWLDAALK